MSASGAVECARQIVAALGASRLDLSSEKATQAGVASSLEIALPGVKIEREVRLSSTDVVDLVVGGAVAVEVKLRGQGKMAIYRQLCRYAGHECVQALVLATNQSMGLPREIGGKPAFYVSLGRGWM